MICEKCSSLAQNRKIPPFAASLQAGDRLGVLFCEACGSLLALPDSGDVILDKLTQLARFGLSAGNGPLMKSKKSGE